MKARPDDARELLLLLGLLATIIVVAVACPAPAPVPSPSPSPLPTPIACVIPSNLPDCGPGITSSCWQPREGVGSWNPDLVNPPPYVMAVRTAQASVGDQCGKNPVASLELLAGSLKQVGYCAERMNDAVFIRRPDSLFEEMHAVYYLDGCWLSNPYKGAWAVIP